jgi:hypothetical protein
MTALEKNQNITAILALSLQILLSLHVVLLLLLLIATNLFRNSIKLLPMSELVFESDRIQKTGAWSFLDQLPSSLPKESSFMQMIR